MTCSSLMTSCGSSITRWLGCWGRIKKRSRTWPKSPALAWTRRSRSSPRWARRPRRFRPRSSSPRGRARCPGAEESAGVNASHRCPKGNRQMRRRLNQAANAAVKTKGSIFELVYRRLVPRLGHAQAIGAIAHRLCRLIWKILHQGLRYEERGPEVSRVRMLQRAAKMIRDLRSLGYRVDTCTVSREDCMSGSVFRFWFERAEAAGPDGLIYVVESRQGTLV